MWPSPHVLAVRVLGHKADLGRRYELLLRDGAAVVELQRPVDRVGTGNEACDVALRGQRLVFLAGNPRRAQQDKDGETNK